VNRRKRTTPPPPACCVAQDPRILAKRWQANLRTHVFQWFAKQRLVGKR
jgi:hypothetical protein